MRAWALGAGGARILPGEGEGKRKGGEARDRAAKAGRFWRKPGRWVLAASSGGMGRGATQNGQGGRSKGGRGRPDPGDGRHGSGSGDGLGK